MEIRLRTRSGDEYTLDVPSDAATEIFERLKDQSIEAVYPAGWVPVRAEPLGVAQARLRVADLVLISLAEDEGSGFIVDAL